LARLSRLVLAGQAHSILQRGHSGQRVFADAADRAAYGAALREAAAAEQVKLHAYALLDTEVQLLATPAAAPALSRMMQAVGRRYVSAYNRRHGRTGTLWDGRFRCAVVEPGATLLDALCLIDGQTAEPGQTSAGHRTGGARDPLLTDPPEYWALGNTPFDREAAYRGLLAAGLPAARGLALRQAALGGWAAGSPAYAAQVAKACARPAQPRPRGRPRRTSA
jgi:putative transposase